MSSQGEPTVLIIKLALGCLGAAGAFAVLAALGSIAEAPEF
jgi:hypothetical protein